MIQYSNFGMRKTIHNSFGYNIINLSNLHHRIINCRWCKVTIDRSLLESLLPGPVTLVFTRRDTLNTTLNPGRELVGVRIPDYPLIQDLCNSLDEPIALTSANVSNHKSSVQIHVSRAQLSTTLPPLHTINICN